ncbi:MAG: AMP-binding protein, partial [Burkholderiaceae bacterium]|nr:AMP-binding protein [Burkholderiaceae bacterium]
FAIIKVGAIAVPLNTRYRTQDLAYALRQSGSVMAIITSRIGPTHADALMAAALGEVAAPQAGRISATGAPALQQLVVIGESAIPGALGWSEFLARAKSPEPTAVALDPSQPALMVYTSGTTGNPKGVLLNHSGIHLCRAHALSLGLHESDVQLTYLPLFHTYALSLCVIGSFLVGARQILMEAFDAHAALALTAEKRVTVVHGFDAHFNDFLQATRSASYDISSLRVGTLTVGAESSVALARDVQAHFCPTLSCYGMTEFWGAVTLSALNASLEQRCEASGLVHPGLEVRIVDPETQAPAPQGVMGEIQVRGYSRMVGYYANAEATAKAFDADGWYRTGDAGVLRSDGHLRYLARYKDILKVGGENVSPAEVEAVLCAIPGVRAVAIVGAPHDRLQEVPVAFVVAAPDGPVDAQSVIDFCKGKIASFKIPRQVFFVDELPMTPTGKVQKEFLRQRLQAATTDPVR